VVLGYFLFDDLVCDSYGFRLSLPKEIILLYETEIDYCTSFSPILKNSRDKDSRNYVSNRQKQMTVTILRLGKIYERKTILARL
jgi:hypothetical protein